MMILSALQFKIFSTKYPEPEWTTLADTEQSKVQFSDCWDTLVKLRPDKLGRSNITFRTTLHTFSILAQGWGQNYVFKKSPEKVTTTCHLSGYQVWCMEQIVDYKWSGCGLLVFYKVYLKVSALVSSYFQTNFTIPDSHPFNSGFSHLNVTFTGARGWGDCSSVHCLDT